MTQMHHFTPNFKKIRRNSWMDAYATLRSCLCSWKTRCGCRLPSPLARGTCNNVIPQIISQTQTLVSNWKLLLLQLCDYTWIFNGCWANINDRISAIALTGCKSTHWVAVVQAGGGTLLQTARCLTTVHLTRWNAAFA